MSLSFRSFHSFRSFRPSRVLPAPSAARSSSLSRRPALVAATVLAAWALFGVTAHAADGPSAGNVGSAANATPIHIVAAENFYGNLARDLGGTHVKVDSILSNPNQDPHSFEASPAVARALSGASLVVYNGIDYDPWMKSLLAASPRAARTEIIAAQLTGHREGDNPHLWYDPATIPAVAKAISAYLVAHDPAHGTDYTQRLQHVLDAQQAVTAKVAQMRARYKGIQVSATEPVFGYMAEAVGLNMLNQRFQLAVMNETEPAASDVAEFEKGLKSRQIKVLLYNAQTSDQMSRRLQNIAASAGVPVVPVTETEPPGVTYTRWMLNQLDALDKALSHGPQ